MNLNKLVEFLVWILVACICIYVVHLVIGMLALPAAVRTIAMLIVGVVFLIFILQRLGIIGGGGTT